MARLAQLLVFGFLVCSVFAIPSRRELLKKLYEYEKRQENEESWDDFQESCRSFYQVVCAYDAYPLCRIPGGQRSVCNEYQKECEKESHDADQCLGYHLGNIYCDFYHICPDTQSYENCTRECRDGANECVVERIPWGQCKDYHMRHDFCADKADIASCEADVATCAKHDVPQSECLEYSGISLRSCMQLSIPDERCPGYHYGIKYCEKDFLKEHQCPGNDDAACIAQCKGGVTECAQVGIPMDVCGDYHNAKGFCADYCKNEENRKGCNDTCLEGAKECANSRVPMQHCGVYHGVKNYYCETEYAIRDCLEGLYECVFDNSIEKACFDELQTCMKDSARECTRGAQECYQNGVNIERCGHFHQYKDILSVTYAMKICKEYRIPEKYCIQGLATCAVTEGVSTARECEEHHIKEGNIHGVDFGSKESEENEGGQGGEGGQQSQTPEKKELQEMGKLKRFMSQLLKEDK